MESNKLNKSESKYYNTACLMNEALILLLEKKEYSFITIKEICEKAGVNRSTFYLHYLSIDDFYFLGVTILGYEQDGVTPIEEGAVEISVKIFSGETVEKHLSTLRKRHKSIKNAEITDENGASDNAIVDIGSTGHTFKKMIESYENNMK